MGYGFVRKKVGDVSFRYAYGFLHVHTAPAHSGAQQNVWNSVYQVRLAAALKLWHGTNIMPIVSTTFAACPCCFWQPANKACTRESKVGVDAPNPPPYN